MPDAAKATKVITAIGSVISALTVRVECDDDDGVKRVTVLGLPVWDRDWRGVQRRRARREVRERDAR